MKTICFGAADFLQQIAAARTEFLRSKILIKESFKSKGVAKIYRKMETHTVANVVAEL